ncbi:recombinase family protein [Streptomyces sp. IBSNAI002]|uniref:recombinase family protein n=1 Tax=Streptomyces sp. IBSNAI002 TaxID=3457500 RepID=UPI003FD006AE
MNWKGPLTLGHQLKEPTPETPVILTVHELERLARNATELMSLFAELQAGGIQLELLTGPLIGIYAPRGGGAMLFAVLADAGQIERNHIRERSFEGQVTAAASTTDSSTASPPENARPSWSATQSTSPPAAF